MVLLFATLWLVQTTAATDSAPEATASELCRAMIAADGNAARALFAVPRDGNMARDRIDRKVQEIESGRFKDARVLNLRADTRGDVAVVEVDWEYAGQRVWEVLYFVRRDGRWLALSSDVPVLLDHEVTDAERLSFRELATAHEARRDERLTRAGPRERGAASLVEAAERFQSAINAGDANAMRELFLRTTMRLVDGAEQRIEDMKNGRYGRGELVVEATNQRDTVGAVIIRARTGEELSSRNVLYFVRRNDQWYLLGDVNRANHALAEFVKWRELGQWQLEWELRPAQRGPAPTPELAALWASEELPHAAAAGDLDRIVELLELGGKPSSKALDAALQQSHWRVAETLHEAGADLNGLGLQDQPLLSQLIGSDRIDQAKWVIERGRGKLGQQLLVDALYVAAGRTNIELVRLLLDAGADPRVLPRHGVPVLFAAIDPRGPENVSSETRIKLVDLLIRSGADPLATNTSTGTSLLEEACGYQCDPQIVHHLLRLNVFGKFHLHAAFRANCYGPNSEVLQMLIEAGARISEMDREESVLIKLIHLDKTDSIPWLLERGADPNARTRSGETALLAAIRTSPYLTVKALIERGGDPTLKDAEGRDGFAIVEARLARQPKSGEAVEIRDHLSKWKSAHHPPQRRERDGR